MRARRTVGTMMVVEVGTSFRVRWFGSGYGVDAGVVSIEREICFMTKTRSLSTSPPKGRARAC